jgi:bifunctional non-homologous end joining protein LigD
MVAGSSGIKARTARTRAKPATKPKSSGSLAAYQAKRNFSVTSEPKAKRSPARGNRFVVQKHDARRLHYDLRLEMDGVLKSWAVTRGPSLVPGEKRLSVHTEDHPLKYIDFEGVIPAGQYGGGTMIVWDQGRWIPDGDPHDAYARGRLTFTLDGARLKGKWHLVRTRGKPGQRSEQWLLLKSDDEAARTPDGPDILEQETTSLKSGRTIEELAAQGDIRIDHAERAKVAKARPQKARVSVVDGAKEGVLPTFVEPALAKLVESAPRGSEWLQRGATPDPKGPRLDGKIQACRPGPEGPEDPVGLARRRDRRRGRGWGLELLGASAGAEGQRGTLRLLRLRSALPGRQGSQESDPCGPEGGPAPPVR